MTINPEKIIQQRLALSIGLDKYEFLQSHVFTLDVSADIEFQRIFNGFYMVRRNKAWRTEYYKLFESLKNGQNLSFSTILKTLHEKTGNIEPSFSSKMRASGLCRILAKPVFSIDPVSRIVSPAFAVFVSLLSRSTRR